MSDTDEMKRDETEQDEASEHAHRFEDKRRHRDSGATAPGESSPASGDDYLRLAADFENFKRRKAQELLDRARYASEDAVVALVPVLDNLRRALEHAPSEGAEDFVNGVTMVARDFDAALERLGVVPIDTENAPFDPSIHEAIGGEESDDVDRDTVIAEIQRGYRLHDRVLRPALVRVAHPRHPATT